MLIAELVFSYLFSNNQVYEYFKNVPHTEANKNPCPMFSYVINFYKDSLLKRGFQQAHPLRVQMVI